VNGAWVAADVPMGRPENEKNRLSVFPGNLFIDPTREKT